VERGFYVVLTSRDNIRTNYEFKQSLLVETDLALAWTMHKQSTSTSSSTTTTTTTATTAATCRQHCHYQHCRTSGTRGHRGDIGS
jgi:hypothetical protein